MELADQQVSENEALVADVPAEAPETSAPAAAEKPEKLSLRQQIEKNVETVRTEEAKRARAADGKFAKLEAGAAEKPATAEIQKPSQDAQAESPKPSGPPPGWSTEAKAIWDTLPQAVKDAAIKREIDVAAGFEKHQPKIAQLQEITQVLDPIRPEFQKHGLTDAQAVKRLFEWEGSFRNPQTRVQAFHNLARQYGVDLSTLVPSSQSAAPQAQDIPEPLRPVIDQFGNIVQQVQEIGSRVQSWEQSQISDKLSAFASDPKHPHFEAVRATMGQLMTAGLASDLEQAYQKAVVLDPAISAQIKADEEKNRQAELAKANAEKLKRASSAAISPSARPPTGQAGGTSPPKSSVRESLLSNIKALREERRA